jgi:hypothetical protein
VKGEWAGYRIKPKSIRPSAVAGIAARAARVSYREVDGPATPPAYCQQVSALIILGAIDFALPTDGATRWSGRKSPGRSHSSGPILTVIRAAMPGSHTIEPSLIDQAHSQRTMWRDCMRSDIDIMRSDIDIKRDVEDELRSDPDIDATDIAVAVKDGVVMLTGFVPSFRQKRKAEEDVKRVAGVIGVANNIEVRLPIIHRRPHPDIARDVVDETKRNCRLPGRGSESPSKTGGSRSRATSSGTISASGQRKRSGACAAPRASAITFKSGRKSQRSTSNARSRRPCDEPPRSTRVASQSRPTAAKSSCGERSDRGQSARRQSERHGARPVSPK